MTNKEKVKYTNKIFNEALKINNYLNMLINCREKAVIEFGMSLYNPIEVKEAGDPLEWYYTYTFKDTNKNLFIYSYDSVVDRITFYLNDYEYYVKIEWDKNDKKEIDYSYCYVKDLQTGFETETDLYTCYHDLKVFSDEVYNMVEAWNEKEV